MKPHILQKALVTHTSAILSVHSSVPTSEKTEDNNNASLGRMSLYKCPAFTKRSSQVAPKPPKKRYLEENYSENNYSQVKITRQETKSFLPMNGMSVKSVNLSDLVDMEPNENALPKEVLLGSEGNCDPSGDSWRKRLLCWERMSDFDECPADINSAAGKEVNNNELESRKEVPELSSSEEQVRRGRARACKGQKYREFMWTSVIHSRRKSSRWELCQDSVQESTKQSPKNHSSDISDSPLDQNIVPESKVGSGGVDSYYRKKKMSGKGLNKVGNKKSIETRSDSNQNECNDVTNLPHSSTVSPVSTDSEEGKTGPIVGSKKRKMRQQSIRRLQPGSTFKDTSVVEECSLAALSAKPPEKKLRNSPPAHV